MKKTILAILILTFVLSPVFAMGKLNFGKQKMSFTLNDLSNDPINLDSYVNNKVVLLAFFTTWCPWCQQEMPLLQVVSNRYKSKGLEVIGVGINETRENLTAFANANKLTYKILVDDKGKVANTFKVREIPSVFLIDKSGKVRFKALFVTVDVLQNEIEKVLK
jgi:cytochrome c biogenesis protein CcmG, thiol:disulfide interchange protein DsbE